MKFIEQTHAAAQKAAEGGSDTPAHLFEAALREAGIDRSTNFTGTPEEGLMHHYGTAAFQPEVFQPLKDFAMRVTEARASQPSPDERLPILFVGGGPVGFGQSPVRRHEGRFTSLAVLAPGSLALVSSVRVAPESETFVAGRDGRLAAAAVVERVAGLQAETATIATDITSAERSGRRSTAFTRTAYLPLYLSRLANDGAIGRQEDEPIDPLAPASFINIRRDRLAGRLRPSIAIGWQGIAAYLNLNARQRQVDEHSAGAEIFGAIIASPEQQIADLRLLALAHHLKAGEHGHVRELQNMLRGDTQQAMAA